MVKIGQKRLFKKREGFREWLEKNYDTKTELWLIFYKKHTGKNTIQYEEAVEEALCFGWIDGILKRIDDKKHVVRFSPRHKNSVWSDSNIARVKKLIKEGKMTEVGLAKYKALDKSKQEPAWDGKRDIPDFIKKEFKNNKKVWQNFNDMPPSHQKQYIWWITEAKKEETKQRRLEKAKEMIANKKRPGIG